MTFGVDDAEPRQIYDRTEKESTYYKVKAEDHLPEISLPNHKQVSLPKRLKGFPKHKPPSKFHLT